jgi:hypothetical protein
MGIRRAMVLLENVNGLSEDRFVNTFHFASGDDPDSIVQALRAFYNAGNNGGLSQFISTNVTRTTGKSRIKIYDLDDPKIRPTIRDEPLDILATSSTTNLPNELAACVSFYGGRNLKRQRGRVYVGPLTVSALEQVSAPAPDELVAGGFASFLVSAATALMDDPATTWGVYSRMDNVLRPVSGGWVDRAFDIQRRRGVKTASRFQFGI